MSVLGPLVCYLCVRSCPHKNLAMRSGLTAWYRKSFGEKSHAECQELLEAIQEEKPKWIIERLTDVCALIALAPSLASL